MKKLPILAAATFLSSVMPLSAQDAAVEEAVKVEVPAGLNTSNDVAFAMNKIVINMFTDLVEVKDEAGAKEFKEKSKETTAQLLAHVEKIKTLPKPTEAELKMYAANEVASEAKMQEIMPKMMAMMANPENQAVSVILQQVMQEFTKSVSEIMPTMESYYPKEKLKPFKEQIQAEQAEQVK